MLYPKIKRKKSRFKIFITNITSNIKNTIYTIIKIIQSREYFILFMKKNFHF